MKGWSWSMVEDRMIAAESTLRRLPEEALRGNNSSWPDVVRESFEAYGYNPNKIKTRPSPRDIDMMRVTLQWLLWINITDRRIVWGRAERKHWDRLAGENGLMGGVPEAQLCWQAGLLASRIV